MHRARLTDVTFKHGTHGPGYLMRGPMCDMGVLQLRPGDDYRNHYHAHSENSFYVLEGQATLWIDGRTAYVLAPGDFHRCDPLEMHYFANDSADVFRAVFVRTPYDPADTIEVPWRPGEPAPPLPHGRSVDD